MSKIQLVSIARAPTSAQPLAVAFRDYLARAQRMQRVEHIAFANEDQFRRHLDREGQAQVTLLHPQAPQLSSEDFASAIRKTFDSGVKLLVFAIGPADGWSAAMLAYPQAVRLSFGSMTLPHELALLVLGEQVYRALTILAGHPYHSGH